jgi:hypothetical protein
MPKADEVKKDKETGRQGENALTGFYYPVRAGWKRDRKSSRLLFEQPI